jgi:DNA-binding NarL/FixJ family response regulator
MPNKTPDLKTTKKAPRISVVLVDDHNLVRLGFRRILEDEPDIEVVAEASNGDDAVALARKLRPDVIVMDCALPGVSGLAATKTILQEFPAQMILMLSMHAEDTLVRQAIDAGARGYILKNAEDIGLGSAIRRVVAGELVLSPAVSKAPSLKGDRDSKLTTRELEVLQLIADGHSNKAIADQLNLSVNTIAVHRANIMDALGIHKTAELIVYAIRNGLVNIS